MQTSLNISAPQFFSFGNTENGGFVYLQSIDYQYLYYSQISTVFTGKELDPETGYSYFGARYMDHTPLTLWLSVDPMSDKYPSISPYAYCAWNPLKLVDDDGLYADDPPLRKLSNRFIEAIQTGYNKVQSAYESLRHPVLLSNTFDATVHYYYGNGKTIGLTNELGDALINTTEFKERHDRIINGETSALSGYFGVDMTWIDPLKTFFIGDTRVDYTISISDDNSICTVTYTLFSNDGYYDPNYISECSGDVMRNVFNSDIERLKADREGDNLELRGTPYVFIPQTRQYVFKNPGYNNKQSNEL